VEPLLHPALWTALIAITLVYTCLKCMAGNLDREVRLHRLRIETFQLRQRHYAAMATRQAAAPAATGSRLAA
jgi:hypothetical protein